MSERLVLIDHLTGELGEAPAHLGARVDMLAQEHAADGWRFQQLHGPLPSVGLGTPHVWVVVFTRDQEEPTLRFIDLRDWARRTNLLIRAARLLGKVSEALANAEQGAPYRPAGAPATLARLSLLAGAMHEKIAQETRPAEEGR